MSGNTHGGGEAGQVHHGLLLTFAPGERPDRERIVEAIEQIARATISHDPATATGRPRHVADLPRESRHEAQWLELLLDGLTFDLVGLAPGPPLAAPEIAHRFNCEVEDRAELEAIGLFPGPHITHGARSLPILRALLGLGAGLADTVPAIRTVCWTPARSAIAPQFFVRSVRSWLDGGPFPALGMLGLWFDDRGALRSEGLHFLKGSELMLDPALTEDRAAAMRLAVRIVHELIGAELPRSERELLTEAGDLLILAKEPAAAVIAVRPG